MPRRDREIARWIAAISGGLAAGFAACAAAEQPNATVRWCAGLAAGFASFGAALNAMSGPSGRQLTRRR